MRATIVPFLLKKQKENLVIKRMCPWTKDLEEQLNILRRSLLKEEYRCELVVSLVVTIQQMSL